MNQPVNLPINWRTFWGENGSLIVGSLCLFPYLSIVHSGNWTLLDQASVFLLPASAFFSARTVLRLFDRHAPTIGWWLRGLVRWLSWWLVHGLIMVVVFGITEDQLFPKCPQNVMLVVVLGISSLALVRQALHDYAVARYEFGSIAKAGRAARLGRP